MLKTLTFLGLGDSDKTTYIKHNAPKDTCETDLSFVAYLNKRNTSRFQKT